ncbi:MAG: hypothetical protein JWN14_1648 [Chthonomonadales bacterium]|nr:hypothetical protein [Chthonomonadales bacterium]
MALKRSGVRASFAPSNGFGFPRIRRSSSLSACSLFTRFALLFSVACLLVSTSGRTQQTPPKTTSTSKTDVFLFIHPDSPSTAQVGLSYGKRVPHSQVQGEIDKLLSASGWKLSGKPKITDASARPDKIKRFPPVTGAKFALVEAPQFRDNAPLLAPYLRAFQAWDRLDIMFVTTDMVPYNGVTDFRNPAVDVLLEKSDGIYDFRVTIREHSKELPPLTPGSTDASADHGGKSSGAVTPVRNPRDAGATTLPTAPSLFWPYLSIITGCLLVGGVCFYLLTKRNQDNLKPGRSG